MNFLSYKTQYTRYMHYHNVYALLSHCIEVARTGLNVTLYVCARNPTSVVGRLLAAALNSRHPLTHSDLLFCCHFTRSSVPMFISVRCMDDKIFCLGGLASQWCPPQPQNTHSVIYFPHMSLLQFMSSFVLFV